MKLNKRDRQALALAAGFGAIAGLRSVAAPRYFSAALAAQPKQVSTKTLASRLASRGANRTLARLAAGEFVADKLPMIPARTRPLPLAGRLLSGLATGWLVAEQRKAARLPAALIGAAAAVATSFAAFYLRRAATQRAGLADAAVAVAEDALVVTAGNRLAVLAR